MTMEDTIIFFFACLVLLLVFLFLRFQKPSNTPPYPFTPLPIFGHLYLLLKKPFHHTLHAISESVGPIFSLHFGTRTIVVVSSYSLAAECFGKNDIILANRPQFPSAKYLSYNYRSLTSASYGDYWRNLRRVSTLEIFSSARLNASLALRTDEVGLLLAHLYRETADLCSGSSSGFGKVQLKSVFSNLSFNIMMRLIVGKRYFADGEDNEEAIHFKEIAKEISKLAGVSDPGDFLPILGWLDYFGVKRKLNDLSRSVDSFIQGLIDEHRGKGVGDLENRNTMIDHLLSLQKSEPEYYSDKIIKSLVTVMLLAGTDTTSLTLEWAMSHLLNNPEVLLKAREELDVVVGQDHLVSESDTSNLHYLQSIIMETLRLSPVAPLLLPHFSSSNLTLGGYTVPQGTVLLVNAWSIHRDPEMWEEALKFKPERFEGGDGEKGKMMPFGLGRRSCPGAGLAQKVMMLTLGAMIQCFEWERIGGMAVEMEEGEGITMPKLVPLEAMCKPRGIMNLICSHHL